MLLSLDVSFGNLGWSLIDKGKILNCGVISPDTKNSRSKLKTDQRAEACAWSAKELISIIEKEKPDGIIGELPGGSQNACAANTLGIATGLVISVCAAKNLPFEWVTPNEVKKAVTGRLNATKDEIMDKVAAEYGWGKATKKVEINKGKRAGMVSENVWYLIGNRRIAKTHFEHIADSIGVYWASKHKNLVRLFG